MMEQGKKTWEEALADASSLPMPWLPQSSDSGCYGAAKPFQKCSKTACEAPLLPSRTVGETSAKEAYIN